VGITRLFDMPKPPVADASAPVVRILFMTANPSDTSRIAVGEEHQEIDQRLRASDWRDRFVVVHAPEVRAGQLGQMLQRHRPTVVHFSGHGSEEGELLLPDATGRAMAVQPHTVAQLFAELAPEIGIRCVLLNACFSEVLAAAIAPHVDCVIGMRTALMDKAAIRFGGAFYEALGFGHDIPKAFRLACIDVQLAYPSLVELPRLHCREAAAPAPSAAVPAAPALPAPFARVLPQPDELDSLRALLAVAPPDPDVCRRACLAADAGATALATGDGMLLHLAGFSTAAPVPKLVVFAHHVALKTADVTARRALLAWAAAHAARHGRDTAAVDAHWATLEARRLRRHCLMVVLVDDEVGRYRMKAWFGDDRGCEAPVPTRDEALAPDQLAAAIDDLLYEEPVYSLLLDTGARLLVELIAPLGELLPADGQRAAGPACSADHDLVLRWRERVYQHVKRPPRGVRPGLWQRKWNVIRQGAATWAPPLASPADDVATSFQREDCVALALPSRARGASRERRLAILEGALQHGLPVVAWLSDEAPEVDPPTAFDALTTGAPVEALDRVSAARKASDPRSSERHLTLLWDDPERLPPDARRAAQLAAPTRG
jgi:hypothetical protein